MAIDGRIHGFKGAVLIRDEGSPAYNVLGDISGFSIDMTRAQVDVTAMRDTNIRRVSGLPDFSGDLNALWNAANVVYLDAVLAGDPVGLKLVPNYEDDPDVFFQGEANIDGSMTTSATTAVTIAGTWSAYTNWTLER